MRVALRRGCFRTLWDRTPILSNSVRIGVLTHVRKQLLSRKRRSAIDFAGPVFAGVMVVASAPMARKLSVDVPQLAVPPRVIDRIERDPDAGVTIACDLIEQIRQSGAFDGVHLIPVSRYRDITSRLEPPR